MITVKKLIEMLSIDKKQRLGKIDFFIDKIIELNDEDIKRKCLKSKYTIDKPINLYQTVHIGTRSKEIYVIDNEFQSILIKKYKKGGWDCGITTLKVNVDEIQISMVLTPLKK